MASLNVTIDPEEILKKGEHSDKMLLQMIKSGQEVMVDAMKSSASKYKDTGDMANSIKATKPVINKEGNPVGRVKFIGDDRKGMSNSAKALWLEYGTTKRRATPFVRPAIEGSQNAIYSAMKKVEQEEMKQK